MLDLLTSGLSVVFAPQMFILIIFAVFLGTLFGALPVSLPQWRLPLAFPLPIKWMRSMRSRSWLRSTVRPSQVGA